MPTHGLLIKAGKVRAQTPKVESTSNGRSQIPQIKNRSNYLRCTVNAPKDNWRRRH
jgi:ribosomal protein S30